MVFLFSDMPAKTYIAATKRKKQTRRLHTRGFQLFTRSVKIIPVERVQGVSRRHGDVTRVSDAKLLYLYETHCITPTRLLTRSFRSKKKNQY